jgi:hypothetical protein
VRRLAVLIGLVGVIGGVRRLLLDRDQRAFDERYGPRRTPSTIE